MLKYYYQVSGLSTQSISKVRSFLQGCASWNWFFPYHYAPFASDFGGVCEASVEFPINTQPFKPLEQLMGAHSRHFVLVEEPPSAAVFPAGSRRHVPPCWQPLFTEINSPVIDFYPSNFVIDLNGKKFDWQGVALLPFIEEGVLYFM